ncbi:MAG: winged helix-turn-helix domain-containing protein [Nanoarchaeota archaeon]
MSTFHIEKEILDAVKYLKEPSITQIKVRCGLSIPTIKQVCKKLVDEGYLKDVEGYRYCLTDKGRGYTLRSGDSFDSDIVKDIASQVAEKISKQIAGKRFILGQEREISIKTDFIPQIEDETGLLESNINKLGIQLEKEEAQKLEESAKILKNVKRLGK